MKKLARLVREQHSLIIFPEGTRSIDGRVAKFKGGSFLIAVDAGLPVVPISIEGSRHVMFRGQVMVRPGTVTLTVHEPIETKRSLGGDGRDDVVSCRRHRSGRTDRRSGPPGRAARRARW